MLNQRDNTRTRNKYLSQRIARLLDAGMIHGHPDDPRAQERVIWLADLLPKITSEMAYLAKQEQPDEAKECLRRATELLNTGDIRLEEAAWTEVQRAGELVRERAYEQP